MKALEKKLKEEADQDLSEHEGENRQDVGTS